MPDVSGSSSALSTACLARRAASGGRLATNRATSITWSSQSRERTLWLTSPSFTAISVSIRRPVRTISIVRWRPIVRVSRWVAPPPGISPSASSGDPNWVPSVAITMSHVRASSQPPPSAMPDTAAMVGVSGPRRRRHRSAGSWRSASATSPPMANTSLVPAMTTQRTSGLASKPSKTSTTSRSMGAVSVLRLGAWSIRISPTAPSRSVVTARSVTSSRSRRSWRDR